LRGGAFSAPYSRCSRCGILRLTIEWGPEIKTLAVVLEWLPHTRYSVPLCQALCSQTVPVSRVWVCLCWVMDSPFNLANPSCPSQQHLRPEPKVSESPKQ
jgi:hypothetical protein